MPFSGSDHSKSQSSPWSGISTGLTILSICYKFYSWGLSPPCIHMIFSSTNAQTGITLKTSENNFHSFKLYFLLPSINFIFYIHHKTHKFYWYLSINDYPVTRKSFMDVLSCKLTIVKYIRLIVFLYQYSRPKINSFDHLDIHHIRKVLSSRKIGHECHLL